jgi:hypothetical protein
MLPYPPSTYSKKHLLLSTRADTFPFPLMDTLKASTKGIANSKRESTTEGHFKRTPRPPPEQE